MTQGIDVQRENDRAELNTNLTMLTNEESQELLQKIADDPHLQASFREGALKWLQKNVKLGEGTEERAKDLDFKELLQATEALYIPLHARRTRPTQYNALRERCIELQEKGDHLTPDEREEFKSQEAFMKFDSQVKTEGKFEVTNELISFMATHFKIDLPELASPVTSAVLQTKPDRSFEKELKEIVNTIVQERGK